MDNDNSNGFYLNNKSIGSIEDLGNLLEGKSYGKLLLFNSKNELLVIQRNQSDPEYPMHYSLIDFIIDKENNTLSQIIDKADNRKKIKISYCHHNNPQEKIDEKLYIIKFNSEVIYQDKKMKQTFWADQDKLDEFRESHEYILTPLFRKLIMLHQPFYDNINKINTRLNLGDLEYYDTNKENDYILYQPYSYMQSCGGKKFRSKLIDICSTWFQINKKELNSIKYVIETIHCCTLIIDDIEDGSQTRRKCKCAHIIYGEPLSINATYLKLFTLLNDIDNLFDSKQEETKKAINYSMEKLHIGQGTDIYWMTKKYCPSIDQYLNMIDNKTGELLNLLIKLMIIHSDDKIQEKKEEIQLFFKSLGRFFQIRDDYINLTSFSYWEERGLCTDIEEGKFTYPLILAMTELENYEILYEILTSPDRYLQEKKLQALDIMQRSGCFNKTRDELDKLKAELSKLSEKISNNDLFCKVLESLTY